MIARCWAVYSVELSRALRLKQTYVGPLLVLAAVFLAPLARPISENGASAYEFLAYIAPLAIGSIGFLFVLAYSAGLIAHELAHGTIRHVLVRPIHRYEYVIGKLAAAMTYAVALTGIAGVGGWLIATASGNLMGVTYGGELVYTAATMRNTYALALLLTLAPQFAGAAFGLMVSTWTRNPVAASIGVIGVWLLSDMAKYAVGVERFVFTTYLDRPWEIFSSRLAGIEAEWTPMAWYCLGASAVIWIVCTGVAMLVLERRNLSR